MKPLLTLLRVVLGGLFFGHGTQKLFGWFGGHGLDGTAGFFESLGLRPSRRHATAAGIAEAGGGALLAANVLTPAAAAAISGTMITAVRTVHWKNGVWNSNGGYELNLLILLALAAIVEQEDGPAWAAAALGAGAAGSAAVLSTVEPEAAPEPENVAAEGGVVAETPLAGDPASTAARS